MNSEIHSNSLFITTCKRSLRRLCFYTCLSVILFTWGVPGQVPPGRYTPPDQVHPPGTRYPHRAGTPPGTRYTPWDQVHPPGTRYTPLEPGTPSSSAYWEIRATSGWYASYWNAFLFVKLLEDFIPFCSADRVFRI